MSSSKLDLLRQHRNDLLLAEVAAWLHDWPKGIDMAIASHWQNNPAISNQKIQQWKNRGKTLKPGDFSQRLEAFRLTDGANEIDMKILCEKGRNPSTAVNHHNHLVRLLGACHDFAHVEKELEVNEAGKQSTDCLAQAFGCENVLPAGLLEPLLKKVAPLLQDPNDLNRAELLNGLHEVFAQAWGDTRRPINEVTLWDWSASVASLYKAELARYYLTGEWRQRDQLSWRLLRVNFDVLRLYAKAIKIADLRAYKHAVDEACKTVKQLVEEEYPLGNEVYRDTTGIYFTFPDVDLPAELAQEIRRRVEEIEPELAPRVAADNGYGNTAADQLKHILHEQRKKALQELAFPISPENYNPCWEAQWKNVPEGKWEVCPICRLRPKREENDACQHCIKRRGSRIEAWKQEPAKTIWLDEIADHNARIALLVGKFDLDDWLSGERVQTMLVRANPNDPHSCMPKNSSTARLRRIWETCRRFWTDTVEKTILEQHPYANDRSDAALRCARLFVTPDNKAGWRENIPYDGTIGGQPISLLWRNEEKRFVTIINLQLAAGGAKTLQEIQGQWSGQGVEVGHPDNPHKRIPFKVEAVTSAMGSWPLYRPYLTLLISPDQFLAFIPASKSLEIAERIRQEYQKQVGKVQNRLPFFLGLVYFQRKTPLMAVMDTAQRMLKQVSMPEEPWTVECSPKDNANWHIRLSRSAQRLQLDVPATMGDGITEDVWYPYFFVEDGVNVNDRKHHFQLQHNKRRLVHVKDLREGDQVRVTPSRFAYLFLEHTAQRFRLDLARDVSLLDELPLLIDMWERLHKSGITDTGLRGVADLLETKAEMWGCESQEFRHLTETTLKESGLSLVTPEDVLSGRFFRCLELHLRILKARLKKEREDEQQSATV